MTNAVSSGNAGSSSQGRDKKPRRMAWWALCVAGGILAIITLLADASHKKSEPTGALPSVSAPGLSNHARDANASR